MKTQPSTVQRKSAPTERNQPELPLHQNNINNNNGQPFLALGIGVGRRKKGSKNVFMSLVASATDVLSQPNIQVILSSIGLFAVPLAFYGGFPRSPPGGFFQAMRNAWDSLMHMSVFLVTGVTLIGACCIVYTTTPAPSSETNTSGTDEEAKPAIRNSKTISNDPTTTKSRKCQQIWKFIANPPRLSLCIIVLFLQLASFASYQQVVSPGWLSNPFLILTGYKVYWPSDLEPAVKGVCVDYKLGDSTNHRDPLCLSKKSWETLSAGALSSDNEEDVQTVLKGLSYAQTQSGGLVVSTMGRDIDEHIDPFRLNVESLVPFFPRLSVVIFENDSKDGSREHFIKWQKEPNKGYEVDLIDCPEAANCVFGKSHRYDAKESKDFFTSSTIGDMHKYRQRVVDHITGSSTYDNYSHILLLDLDIGVSISPLGVLHSLGNVQESAIASSCRQPWPGGLGTLVPPYDFNAFESLTTSDTKWFKSLHKRFCELMPPGDRWRFVCEAASPMKFLQIIELDRANKYPYAVVSAYNGATLYPLKLIREVQPKYDAGDDGQRCEHLSFNRGLKKPMYVNPKWDMHMSPTKPGGPKGEQALKHFRRFGTLPQVAIPLFLHNFIPLSILVLSVMTLGVHGLRAVSRVAQQRFSSEKSLQKSCKKI